MPALIALLLSLTAAAAEGTPPVLDVAVKLHRSVQWTRVYEGKEGWYCATEHNPMFPIGGRPKALALVRAESAPKKGCRETFTARLKDGNAEKTWSGCRDEEAKRFLDALGKECGRF